jgi:hypothetical protein
MSLSRPTARKLDFDHAQTPGPVATATAPETTRDARGLLPWLPSPASSARLPFGWSRTPELAPRHGGRRPRP